MIAYVDINHKCHATNDGTMTPYENKRFDGKCAEFIEGYMVILPGKIWVRDDGEVFEGLTVFPWRDLALLEEFQAQYEAQLADAEAAYIEGVNSI